jgi:hypothetical protein
MGKGEGAAGRSYFRVYRVSGRADVHDFLLSAVTRAEGHVLFATEPTRAPVYLTVEAGSPARSETIGLLVYPFRCNPPPIKGRSPDEHRAQIRYGGEASWEEDHPVGQDPAGVDVTLVLGAHLDSGLFIGLDPLLYDPLPMGISIEFKDSDMNAALQNGWHVWERENFSGRRRGTARAPQGIETLVAFVPERLLDYARFEREATRLRLDSPLRFRAGSVAAEGMGTAEEARHALEEEFELSSREILEIVSKRFRLRVALRGGVAEHHLERALNDDAQIAEVMPIDEDGRPDFEVVLGDGRRVKVECKNISPRPYADGSHRVEVQKTRASKGDPASRLYPPDHFDVVGACLFSGTGHWEFCFKAAGALKRDEQFPDRIAPLQRVDATWSRTLLGALEAGSAGNPEI